MNLSHLILAWSFSLLTISKRDVFVQWLMIINKQSSISEWISNKRSYHTPLNVFKFVFEVEKVDPYPYEYNKKLKLYKKSIWPTFLNQKAIILHIPIFKIPDSSILTSVIFVLWELSLESGAIGPSSLILSKFSKKLS